NNLIWINTAGFDSSQIINHTILTIGRYLDSEELIEFFIATKTQKYSKAIELLNSQGVLVETIMPDGAAEPSTGTTKKRRGRPKKVKSEAMEGKVSKDEAPGENAPKRRGRPPKVKTPEEEAETKKPKKLGRPKKAAKRGRPKKAVKRGRPRKVEKVKRIRVDKPISEEDINNKLKTFPTIDGDVEQIQKKLFGLIKVARPKFDHKLIEMIKLDLAIGDGEAKSLVEKLKSTGMMDNSGKGNRLKYKD
ncbi:MAG: hypothetical protein J7L96_05055, partial [Bacteroidales bacterium]|nr:hypothetical protein [Bacteroidales bacterium]